MGDKFREVIGNRAVLPNRFALEIGSGTDPFQLRHPRPQGVLRFQVVEHKGQIQVDKMEREASGQLHDPDDGDEVAPTQSEQRLSRSKTTKIREDGALQAIVMVTLGNKKKE